jgi:hypothetical protein
LLAGVLDDRDELDPLLRVAELEPPLREPELELREEEEE